MKRNERYGSFFARTPRPVPASRHSLLSERRASCLHSSSAGPARACLTTDTRTSNAARHSHVERKSATAERLRAWSAQFEGRVLVVCCRFGRAARNHGRQMLSDSDLAVRRGGQLPGVHHSSARLSRTRHGTRPHQRILPRPGRLEVVTRGRAVAASRVGNDEPARKIRHNE